MYETTSLTVQSRSSGDVLCMVTGSPSWSEGDRGGTVLLKQVEKKSLSKLSGLLTVWFRNDVLVVESWDCGLLFTRKFDCFPKLSWESDTLLMKPFMAPRALCHSASLLSTAFAKTSIVLRHLTFHPAAQPCKEMGWPSRPPNMQSRVMVHSPLDLRGRKLS